MNEGHLLEIMQLFVNEHLSHWLTTEDIRDEMGNIREEIKHTRDSMLQSLSLLVGFIGIIFAVIIGAAFQPNVLFNPNPAIIGLLSLVVAMSLVWYVCGIYRWLKRVK